MFYKPMYIYRENLYSKAVFPTELFVLFDLVFYFDFGSAVEAREGVEVPGCHMKGQDKGAMRATRK